MTRWQCSLLCASCNDDHCNNTHSRFILAQAEVSENNTYALCCILNLPPVRSTQAASPCCSCPRYRFCHICKITEPPMPNLSESFGTFFPSPPHAKKPAQIRTHTRAPRDVWRQSSTVLAWLSSAAAWTCSKEASNQAVFQPWPSHHGENSSHEKRLQVIKEAVTAATALAPLSTIKPSYGLLWWPPLVSRGTKDLSCPTWFMIWQFGVMATPHPITIP